MTAWSRPEGGREPAAAALLGWLADPSAPPLCVVAGSEVCGKTSLLAWLVRHGSRHGTPSERMVHAVVPVAARTVLGTVWSLGEQLGVLARSAEELTARLAGDGRRTVVVLPNVEQVAVAELAVALAAVPQVRVIVECRTGSAPHGALAGRQAAVLDLDLPQWTDPEAYARWLSSESATSARLSSRPGKHRVPKVDLGDVAAVCAADPQAVTAALEADPKAGDERLRAAWLRAGSSLVRDQDAAQRAVVLLTALEHGSGSAVRAELEAVAAASPWRVRWVLGRGDLVPPWPGPVVALAPGGDRFPGAVLVVDLFGTIRRVAFEDGAPEGRILGSPASALGVLQDGSVLCLQDTGGIAAETRWSQRSASRGIASLVQEQSYAADSLEAVLQGQQGTALAAAPSTDGDVVAVGCATGEVRVLGAVEDQVCLHSGPVTGVAVVSVPLGEGAVTSVVYSGGADGTVRLWAPGGEPMAAPYVRRGCPVVAVHAALTSRGPALAIAWADGLVELHEPGLGHVRGFHPGRPVRGLAVTPTGEVVVGLDDALICLFLSTEASAQEGGVPGQRS
ncbi:hypothetical protein ACFY8W_36400 [Streptomyces sp. NPDC012637]|uniref:hypothetical protein n=1 Tax=Streptomyces sp. NPDC012637 TaxID=3364842 RepID=UPI0036E25F82